MTDNQTTKKSLYSVFTLQLRVHTYQQSENGDPTLEEVQNKISEILTAGFSAEHERGSKSSHKFVISAFDVDPPTPAEPLAEKVDRIERVINTMAKRERDVLKLLTDSIQHNWK